MFHSNRDLTPFRTPTIGQQRAIIAAFVAIISALVGWQNAGGSANRPVQKFSKTPLPNAVAQLDFTSAESSWSSLTIDPQGDLKIDALTYSALVDVLSLLDDQHSEPQMARMALLLEKQFGAITSQQIMELVPLLENYQDIEQRWREENGDRQPPRYSELFRLQDELLGEVLASKLFSKQRRLAKMMSATQEIQNDTSLTQAQKDEALADLEQTFQEGSQEDGADE